MFKHFKKADPNRKYVRTGLVAYADKIEITENMGWGSLLPERELKRMQAGGGTSTTRAFRWAYNQLKSSNISEASAHSRNTRFVPRHREFRAKRERQFLRVIVFMTDGENTDSRHGRSLYINRNDDILTERYCNQAKQDGIIVYSIAFSAAERGKELLKKCSSSIKEHYFEPRTGQELISVFKTIAQETSYIGTRLVK